MKRYALHLFSTIPTDSRKNRNGSDQPNAPEANRCVYYCYDGGEGIWSCVLYVDGILLIFTTSHLVIKETKEFLSNNFETKDLGVTDVIKS